MGDKIRIDIVDRPQLLRTLWTLGGAAKALEALPGPDTVSGKLPGIGMARAIVERVVAEERVFLSQETFKAVAKAGHDVTLCKAVTTAFDPGGKPYLEAEFYDLADMAEG